MKSKDFKKFKIGDRIEIIWLDSSSPRNDGWYLENDFIGSKAEMRIKTTSYFYGIERKHINIAADKMIDKKYDIMVNKRLSIPLGCIEKVRKI